MTFVANGLVKRYGKGTDSDATDTLIASTLKSQRGKGGDGIGPEETLIAGPLGGGNDGVGRRSEDDPNLVAVPLDLRNGLRDDGSTGVGTPSTGIGEEGDPAFAVGSVTQAVASSASVRRLMPVECERLQALPDGWTDLDGTADSKRYAALGDAVTASVSEWIGRRLRVA